MNWQVNTGSVMQAVTRIYGGVPADQRRDQRRRRLMDAAVEIMGSEHSPVATVTGICELARVGPRFFYESFDNLDALAVAVLDEIVASATARAIEAVTAAPDDATAKIRAGVDTIVREFTDDPRRARIVFVEAYGSEPLMRRRFAALQSLAELMNTVGSTVIGLPPEANQFAEAMSLIFVGGIAELVIVWVNGGLAMSREQLIDTCIEVMVSNAANVDSMAARLAQRQLARSPDAG